MRHPHIKAMPRGCGAGLLFETDHPRRRQPRPYNPEGAQSPKAGRVSGRRGGRGVCLIAESPAAEDMTKVSGIGFKPVQSGGNLIFVYSAGKGAVPEHPLPVLGVEGKIVEGKYAAIGGAHRVNGTGFPFGIKKGAIPVRPAFEVKPLFGLLEKSGGARFPYPPNVLAGDRRRGEVADRTAPAGCAFPNADGIDDGLRDNHRSGKTWVSWNDRVE